jgi:tetratricopeptide (TPR) repeat protein
MTAEEYTDRGIAHAQRGENEAAIADYTEAIRLNPEAANFWYGRALLRYEGESAEAA